MRKFKRSQRVADQIKREISALVDSATSDGPFGMVSVTDVTLTDDLRYAKIYISCLQLPRGDEHNLPRGDRGEDGAGGERGDSDDRDDRLSDVAGYLNDRRKKLRAELAGRINIKFVPEIRFVYDPSIERGMRIEAILNELAAKRDSATE